MKRAMRMISFGFLTVGAASGCGDRDGHEGAHDTAVPGMPGMSSPSATMMDEMEAHMRRAEGASGESMRAMMPEHRQMVANLLSQMNREMREMNMAADTAWNATADSVRQDLRRMPEMSARELQAMMPAHAMRVRRMVEMHRRMMGAMGPSGRHAVLLRAFAGLEAGVAPSKGAGRPVVYSGARAALDDQ